MEDYKNFRDYKNFKPTFVYLKQHTITKKLYFGKTTKENVETYMGSGVHWGAHIRKHGNFVETVWYCLFTDPDILFDFCLSYSKLNSIVESNEYANMIDEIGFNGGTHGLKLNREKFVQSEEAKNNRRGKWRAIDKDGNKLGLVSKFDHRFDTGEIKKDYKKHSLETKEMISRTKSGRKMSLESSEKKRQSLIGKRQTTEHISKRSEKLKGKAPAKDVKSGEYVGLIPLVDQRWKDGSIVSIFKGVPKKSFQ